MFDAKDFLKNLTDNPGVYQMMDAAGDVIYVGKAKSLKKRLSSYFRVQLTDKKTEVLVKHISNIRVTVTHTETEALVLEHNLIKQYLPRYNVLLRDDKSYPFIFLSQGKHPRLGFHRGKKKRQDEYFGPFPDASAVRQSLYLLQKIFPVRQCEDSVYANRTRPCLLYQIKRCAGPCVKGLVSEASYAELVQFTRLFLQGKDRQIITQLVSKMEQASHKLEFEQAAKYRDQINALRHIQEQQFVSQNTDDTLDAIGVVSKNGMACVHVLFVRQGKLLGSRSYFPKIPANTQMDEVVSSFMGQFYLNAEQQGRIPKHILLGFTLESEIETLNSALSDIAGCKVSIQTNPRGVRAKFLKLAKTNAEVALNGKINHKITLEQRFSALRQALQLERITRMECFDISHTMGAQTVASCVVFDENGPVKSEYRRYNIDGITGGDDYAAMAQVLNRRYAKQRDPQKMPDIIFIDGGKGQLNRAYEELRPIMVDWPTHPLLLGIAKGEGRKAGLETLVKITGESFSLPADSPALHLIQYIRDESHDHAISRHRAKRAKASKNSVLQDIEGIGAKRRQALLKYLGGMQELRRASIDEIAKVPGISRVLAEKIFYTLHGS